jgi:predicted DNA-binding transcriptional regulator AlpA
MSQDELTTTETMNILRVSRATVTELVKRGHFPGARKMDPTRINSPLRIPRAEVEKFIASQIITPIENIPLG